MNEREKSAYKAKVWTAVSPNGRYHAVVTFDKVVSLSYMESHFKGGWALRPLFPGERETAERKAARANGGR